MTNTYPTIEEVQSRTAFKEEWKARGAIETLKWLEAGAPHKLDGLDGVFHFDFGKFVHIQQGCGTTCCIAGAIVQFGDNILAKYEGSAYAVSGMAWGSYTLERIFGVHNFYDHPELSKLFYMASVPTHLGLNDITPAQAAYALRSYLETGRTEWPEEVLDTEEKFEFEQD